MANKVTIEVEGRFVDNVSGGAEKAQKKVDALDKKKAQPVVDADDNRFLQKLRAAEDRIKRIAGKSAKVTLLVLDKGTAVVNKLESGLKTVTGKTWSTIVRIKDYATAPLRKLRDTLFSIKSLVLAITAGLAAKQLILNPINLADSYASAKIGFSTLLGDTQGQKMMDDLDAFAKATPFKTSEVIANSQKMIAMGWNAEDIIKDMETIGDAAAATGKGDEGLGRIILALSQIKSKGKLSTEELNQLAEAGISAKRYLAEGLGYGTGDTGVAKLSKDLEQGKIGSEKAIQAILEGMKEYKGMMQRTANETVEGLKGQLEDTFEINIFRRWGQGLQDGAKRGMGTVLDLLDKADNALGKFGDLVYDIGSALSNWAADKLENTVQRITDVTGSYDFEKAGLGDKIKMLWKGVISDPIKEWWENGGRDQAVETAGEIGTWTGTAIKNGILAILGVTDLLKDSDLSESGGLSIAQSFAKGFADGFDASVVTDKLVEAVNNVWGALPDWAKNGLLLYGGAKAASGLGSLIHNVGGVLGSAKTGAGLLGFGANTAINLGAGNLAGGASLSAGALSALGLGATAGGIVGGLTLFSGGADLYRSSRARKAGDETEASAYSASSGGKIGGVVAGAGMGAAIGSIIPGLGTLVGGLIGAGVGGIAGTLAGKNAAANIRAAKYESEEMKKVLTDSNATAEDVARTLDEVVWNNLQDRFGGIELSLSEIQRLSKQIVAGDITAEVEAFSSAAQQAEASLTSLQSASETSAKWMWKAGLRVKFSDDEVESIVKTFDEYITDAKSYVENKHYEFTAAVDLLISTDSKTGKSIVKSGDAYYTKIEKQLKDLGKELDGKVQIALSDGVITLDEEGEIENLQNQIAEITNKLANAQADAQMEAIKIKFAGEDRISYDSFVELQNQLKTAMEDQIGNYDTALTASITSLRLQLDDGAISQEEYDKQLQALTDGYTANVDSLYAKVQKVQLDILADAYSDDLGPDAAADLQNAFQEMVDTGLQPMAWDDEKIREILGADDLSEDTIKELQKILQNVFDSGIPKKVSKTVALDINFDTSGINIGGATVRYAAEHMGAISQARGGILDGSGLRGFAAGGMVRGGGQLVRVAEEGTPEMIIPLGSQRRERGLKLWEKAGQMMGVPGFARGGLTNNGDEGLRFRRYSPVDNAGAQTVRVDVGSVTVSIQVDGAGTANIAEAIQAQAGEIAETVAGVLADAFAGQFENTPVRGGAAG